LALGATLAAALGLIVTLLWRERADHRLGVRQQASVAAGARFVGSSACASCHASETSDWKGSQHRAAMAEASQQTVLGDFRGAAFTYAGTRSVFFARDGKFFVRTDGRDGRLNDFEVRYTFGVYPLQQYLVAFGDGRLQPLPIAWDARAKEDGGQRWFHLYPGEHITHNDELHWTRPSQNWNFMCADCHSTALHKNYDATADRFQTRWSEVSVGCEACHGPGSRHLEWASQTNPRMAARDSTKGLTTSLNERRNVVWSNGGGQPTRSKPRTTEHEVQICAQCHSRRGQIADGYEAGKPLLDYYMPALLTRPLYHVDGQQRGEVYDWGSFLQSKMYSKGVTCSDCHNPHSGKLRAQQTLNAVCTGCHLPTKYDTPAHHHHESAGVGAACAACHMPTTTYMVIDPRHDHSLRIPRPDLSVALGTPNACTNCHKNRDAAWAAARLSTWRDPADGALGYQRFASVFAAVDSGGADAHAKVRELAGDTTQPAIARATALADLNAVADSADVATLGARLGDPSPLVRLGALQVAAQLPTQIRAPLVAPLLSDSLRAVRIIAASQLADVPPMQLQPDRRAAFDRAAAEFVDAQLYNADRAEARANLGSFYAERGNMAGAEAELRAAIRADPVYALAYINLADLYRVLGRDTDGEGVLRDGITMSPATGALHYALGLALVRMKRVAGAVGEFHRATMLEPTNASFAYAYAISLQSTGKIADAMHVLQRARAAHPGNGDIVSALAGMRR
jgi:Flp pilus assembly protein TadD